MILAAGRAALLLSTALALPALAQTAPAPGPAPVSAAADAAVDDDSADIVVTAQKRSENLQSVPISIQAIGTKKLDELQIDNFNDYAKFLPSVSFQSGGPGNAQVYFRGVASGGDGNHSGPLPSVGIYLDEQPITTIQGALDIHVYDIARVEALAGPQGTLFGASSQAGTIRIITNKPDPSKFSASYDLEANYIDGGDFGGSVEGYVNVPLSDKAAVRVVGWYDRDGGYIDNVFGTRTYPTSGVTIDNRNRVEDNYNQVETYGGRAQLGIDLDDSWTVTPAIMAQVQKSGGIFGFDPRIGDLKVTHFYPEGNKDRWYQAALTVTGQIADFDITYAGAYLQRAIDTSSDYTDYSFFYDQCCGYGSYIQDNAGKFINPSQRIEGRDRFTKLSQEFRIASPSDKRFRLIAGLFYQRQQHKIEQNYIIDGLADKDQVTGTNDNYWLTKQLRVDRDYAVFGQADFDLTDKLTVTGGGRYYKYDNTLIGFFGYGPTGGNGLGSSGERRCQAPAVIEGSPCTSLLLTDDNLVAILKDGKAQPARAKDSGFIYRGNVTYKFDPDHLVYATVSRGFRPGGINRRGSAYAADFLNNYEIGTKNSFLDRRLTLNATIFQENWKDIQLASLGQNGLTVIDNVSAARIRGVEGDVRYRADSGFSLAASGTYTDAKLTEPYTRGTTILAPKGQELPVTPKFKANVIARYEFPIRAYAAHLQVAATYQTRSYTDLRTIERDIIGRQNSYANVDLTGGVKRDSYTFELYVKNLFDKRGDITRYAECVETVCGAQTYRVVTQPRSFGIRFGQKF